MTIVTQDLELINYDKLSKIVMYSGELDNTEIFAIVGFESMSEDFESNTDIMLGVYNNSDECEEVINSLLEAISVGKAVYQMPEPAVEEVTA